ncbi:MAG TPA: hypothetical protein PLL10_08485 [Elusimicrobiales bacterium]|nr:hypothetical protein [Elusimicrobiales bacterium]
MNAKVFSTTTACIVLACGVCAAEEDASKQLGRKSGRVSMPSMTEPRTPDKGAAPVIQMSYDGNPLAVAYDPITKQVVRKDSPEPDIAIALVYNPKERKMEKPFLASKPGHAVTGVFNGKTKKVEYFQSSQPGMGIAAVYNPDKEVVQKRESKGKGHAIVGFYDQKQKKVVWLESPAKGQIGILHPATNKVMWKSPDLDGHPIAGVFTPSL